MHFGKKQKHVDTKINEWTQMLMHTNYNHFH